MTEMTGNTTPTPQMSDPTPDSTVNLSGVTKTIRTSTRTPNDYFYEMKNTGMAIYIGTPQVGSQYPAFSIEVNPRMKVPTTPDVSTNADYNNWFSSKHPFKPHAVPQAYNDINDYAYYDLYRGTCCVQEHKPDIVSALSHCFRYSFGNFDYYFFTVAKFTDQGCVEITRQDGDRLEQLTFDYPNTVNSQFPTPVPEYWIAPNMTSHNFLLSDLSNQKHISVGFPYKRNLLFRDHGDEDSGFHIQDAKQYLTFRYQGTLISGDDKLIQMRVYRKPQPNFRLFGPVYPFIVYHDAPTGVYPLEYVWDHRMSTIVMGDRTLAPATWIKNYATGYQVQKPLDDPFLAIYPTTRLTIPRDLFSCCTVADVCAWFLRNEALRNGNIVEFDFAEATKLLTKLKVSKEYHTIKFGRLCSMRVVNGRPMVTNISESEIVDRDYRT